ncbi:MAG: hypothetical protein HY841_00660 [Bacteroidetes bacterium]|nr:hypothetical protein [Bacteroidota bacterium]
MSNILVLTYWSYNDALVQAYTLPYLKIIKNNLPVNSKIYLLTLERNNNQINEKGDEQIQWVPFHYYSFGILASFQWIRIIISLWCLIVFKKVSAIHCMGTPAGMIGYILSIFTGKKLIIDSYEPHAESMVENGTWKKNGLPYKILFLFEKLQTKRAFAVIAATASMKSYALKKYNAALNKFYSKPACIDLDLFAFKYSKNKELLNKYNLNNDNIICVYAGKIGGIYLQEEIFDFFSVCCNYWKDKFRIILLPNTISKSEIEIYLKQKKIPKDICIIESIEYEQMPVYLGLADFALNPVKPVPSKQYCTSLKDGEYWAMGLPVVITKNISDDSSIIEENDIGAVLYNFDKENYLAAVKKIDAILNSPSLQKKKEEIRNIAKRFRGFEVAEKIYQEIYA